MSSLRRRLLVKLKDWYSRELVEELAERFFRVFEGFARERFVSLATDGLEELEMMDRVRLIARAMASTFPQPTAAAMRGLCDCLGPALPAQGDDSASVSTGYALWPFGEYIGMVGLDDWESSWTAMEELTQRLTSEFAVRPFLTADLDRALSLFAKRVNHPSHHVRRWVSEGTRTRLPWGKAVPGLREAVGRRLEMLEELKSDPSLYVRRSVANHLQDILKDDLEAGLEVVQRWSLSAQPEVAWVVRHACRGLLKTGHPEILALYGLDQPVELRRFSVGPKEVRRGQSVELSIELCSPKSHGSVRLDFSLSGPTPSGREFRKVFRWSEFELAAGEVRSLQRSFPMVERSTRRLPLGQYRIAVLANGRSSGEQTFRLVD